MKLNLNRIHTLGPGSTALYCQKTGSGGKAAIPVMRSHHLWPWKSQNHTIPVNLEAIQTTTIASKLF